MEDPYQNKPVVVGTNLVPNLHRNNSSKSMHSLKHGVATGLSEGSDFMTELKEIAKAQGYF